MNFFCLLQLLDITGLIKTVFKGATCFVQRTEKIKINLNSQELVLKCPVHFIPNSQNKRYTDSVNAQTAASGIAEAAGV